MYVVTVYTNIHLSFLIIDEALCAYATEFCGVGSFVASSFTQRNTLPPENARSSRVLNMWVSKNSKKTNNKNPPASPVRVSIYCTVEAKPLKGRNLLTSFKGPLQILKQRGLRPNGGWGGIMSMTFTLHFVF
jgi:hypothetical protein